MQGEITDFAQNICGCDYYIIHLHRGNIASLHYSKYSTCCIKAIVCSIRYFNGHKCKVAFFPVKTYATSTITNDTCT